VHWYRNITKTQRLIIFLMVVGILVTIGVLVWSVRTTLLAGPTAVSPTATTLTMTLPTPTLTMVSAETPSPTVIPTFDVATAGDIAAKVADIRGFQGFWGTPLTLVDLYNLSVALYRYYGAHPPYVAQSEIIWEALKLREPESELATQNSVPILDVVTHAENTAAIYFPETEEFYFRRDWADSLDKLEMQLVYGYARAMPDQYGNISGLMAEATTLDRRLALAAVAEGDAILTLQLYAGVEPGSANATQLMEVVASGTLPYWKDNAPVYEDLMHLPLELGGAFTAQVVNQDGLSALDEVILRPPRSTEQILHIERYYEGDEPKVLTPVEPQLGRDWVLQSTETIGEALIGYTMKEWSQGQYTMEIAENWGGDLLQVWDAEDGSTLAIWQIIWDSFISTSKFYDALLDLMPEALLKGTVQDTTLPADLPRGQWWSGRQGTVYITRWANRTTLIWGNSESAVQTAATVLD
jgi:hypothetical protein